MRYIVPLGRVLFAAIFVLAPFSHFAPATVGYAVQAGVPFPKLLVPLSGLVAFAGGLSVLLGYRARIGAWLLVLFLVPVTLYMHRFWGVPDPMMANLQLAFFMKNVSMLGTALVITQLGAGPVSLDAGRSGASYGAKNSPNWGAPAA